jgi:hypothetical protein
MSLSLLILVMLNVNDLRLFVVFKMLSTEDGTIIYLLS